MTREVVALHAPDPGHLAEVGIQMRARKIPDPVILGFDRDGAWQAICGSHRIAAAVVLGVPVTLAWVDPDAPLTEAEIIAAAGELLSDLPLGLTPRQIVEFRDAEESGVRYECEVAR